MNYMEKEKKKNRLMPALITLMLLLSMIIIPQSVIAAAPVVDGIPDQTIDEGDTFATINLDDYVADAETPDAYIVWTSADDGDCDLTVSIVSRVATITIPDTDWFGAETITFTATDNESLFDSDDATFTVTAVNDPPTGDDDEVTVLENTQYMFASGDFTFNDVDTGDTFQGIKVVTTLETVGDLKWNGSDVGLNDEIPVVDIAAGKLTFDPVANEYGDAYDDFDFEVYDGALHSASAYTMTIDVTAMPPGAHEWGDATTDLVYGTTYASDTIKIDTSLWTGSSGNDCYLYCPKYTSAGAPLSADNFTWDDTPYEVGDIDFQVYVTNSEVETDTLNTGGYSILFNRSGMWIFDVDATHSGDDPTSYAGYIWVNTSTDYDISSIADFEYNSSGDITITVQEEENDVGCMMAIIAPDNSTAYHNWQGDGSVTLGIAGNFTMAGDYIVMAYRDFDKDPSIYLYGDENGNAYNSSYGSDYSGGFPAVVSGYIYADVGPWDPPEKNATEEKFTVTVGKPTIELTNTTQYWSFSGTIDINVTDSDGMAILGLNVTILNETGLYPGAYFASDTDASGTSITADWTNGDTGVWTVVVRNSIAGDDLEEWNNSADFTVTSSPGLQFKWIDDDGVISDDNNNDGVIPGVPDFDQQPLDIQFQLINNEHDHYGDGGDVNETAAKKNITVSGDALFVGSLDNLPGVTYSDGTWTVPLIPLMKLNGGKITISANWEGYGSATETLSVGGTKLNGSIVTISPQEFVIDEDVTLTVTVKGPTGYPYPNAEVSLYWINDGGELQGLIDSTTGGGNTAGEYIFLFNKTQQTDNQTQDVDGITYDGPWNTIKAPRNISAYVNLANVGYGYAMARMTPQSDLEVELSKSTIMAGEKTKFYVNVSIVNSTEQPVVDSDNPLQVAIYDTTGDRVTLDASFGSILDSDLDDTNNSINEYFLKPGIYTLYAYNNTHDSEGYNATFEIKAVEVACDKAPFIWSVDANISATFTITYNGNPVNGTFRIDNMSDKGTYNSTWRNCSFTGTSDAGGNTSLEISKTKIINGVVTVHDITVDALTEDKSKEYITLWFKPTESGSVFAKATAQMTVEVPLVTPDPEYIPLGRTTKVYCTATGRGETLSDVFIRLHGQGFDQNSTTDVDGRVVFSVTPASTGNISIDVGEVGRTLTDTVVYVVAWIIDVDVVAEVDEGEQFTVTVTKEGATDVVVDATVTIKGIGTATTDVNGEVTFTSPNVTSDRTYTIKVTAEGYAPDPDTNTIAVINVPKLILVIPDEVQATTTFEVAVADDTGGPIIGATITFNEKTYTTGVNGIAKLTAPKTKGDYPIEATFGTYVKATDIVTVTEAPGIPGFELLTLIVALGVAFILLRRRRR